MALCDADCAEQPIGWLGTMPPCFDGSSPSEVKVEIFGRNAVEGTQPFLETAVIAVDVVDVQMRPAGIGFPGEGATWKGIPALRAKAAIALPPSPIR